MVEAVNFSVSSTKGYAGITQFEFVPSIISSTQPPASKFLWKFGDGSSSSLQFPSHTYANPGNYTVTLFVYVKDSATFTYQRNISISYVLNDSIYFEVVPPPTFAGHINRYPFKLCITSSNTEDHFIDLGAQFSKADQASDLESKWSFLSPTWNFYDLNGKRIQSIKTKDTIIRTNAEGVIDPNGTFVAGTSGFAEFFFTDDIYNADLAANGQSYTTLIATLETSGTKSVDIQSDAQKYVQSFASSKAVATMPYISLWRSPDQLEISENGIRPHANPRWSTSKTPFVISSVNSEEFPDLWKDGNGVKPIHPDSYFSHNFPLSNFSPISIQMGSSSVDVTTDDVPQMVWTDYSYYKTPGFFKSNFDIPNTNTLGICITAAASIPLPELSSNFIQPLLWIPNPEDGSILVTQYIGSPSLSAVSTPNLSAAHVFRFPTASNPHGIYSVAAGLLPSFHAWTLDADSSNLVRYSSIGQSICSVNIQNAVYNAGINPTNDPVSPTTMALDGEQSIWITLHDTTSAIKLDSTGKFVSAVALPVSAFGYNLPFPNTVPVSAQGSSWYDMESSITYYAENHSIPLSARIISQSMELVSPTFIDTDTQNSILVSYTNPMSGIIAKFNSLGELQYTISHPSSATPMDIVCDSEDNYAVAISVNYNPSNPSDLDGSRWDYLHVRNTNGVMLSAIGPFKFINNVAVDLDRNFYFTHGYRNLAKVTLVGPTSSWKLSSITLQDNLSFDNGDDIALEGITTDIQGRVFAINSVENRVYVVNKNFEFENAFFINPQGLVHYLDLNDNPQTFYGVGNKSAHAHGDWSGIRWISKYAKNYLTGQAYNTGSLALSGVSRTLDFYADQSAAYDIFKHNEDYSVAQYAKDLAFMPSLQDSEFLFDDYLGGAFGKYPFNHDDLGVDIYEKIANFVSNHSDIDTCNIDQLYDKASMMDLDTDDFRLNYPPAIRRLIDLASINQKRLWGDNDNFNQYIQYKKSDGSTNRGNLITSLSYTITAGKPVIMRPKSSNDYKLVSTGPINGLFTYNINTLAAFLQLDSNWADQYFFYEYVPTSSDTQLEGIIDWKNAQTSINHSLSSKEAWSGTEGIVETMFSFELYNGLNLLNS